MILLVERGLVGKVEDVEGVVVGVVVVVTGRAAVAVLPTLVPVLPRPLELILPLVLLLTGRPHLSVEPTLWPTN
jgi:hypothetical protein